MSKKQKQENFSNINKFFCKIADCINMLHLYTTKGEALFKSVVITISWAGGVYNQDTPIAYYLFSISIIMEYVIQLVQAKKFFPKFLPILLVVSNIAVFILSTVQILHGDGNFNWQITIEILTIIIIAADAIVTLLIEPSNNNIETSLKDI